MNIKARKQLRNSVACTVMVKVASCFAHMCKACAQYQKDNEVEWCVTRVTLILCNTQRFAPGQKATQGQAILKGWQHEFCISSTHGDAAGGRAGGRYAN